MVLEEKIIKLKNGAEVALKSPSGKDAKIMLDFMFKMYGESDFMTLTLAEAQKMEVEREKAFLNERLDEAGAVTIAAYRNGEIIANCSVRCMDEWKKLCHRAEFGISVLKEYWGLGLGSVLMEHIVDFATESGYEQIELETVRTNERAIALYKKFGFEQTGVIPRAQKLESGEYQDYIIMVKALK